MRSEKTAIRRGCRRMSASVAAPMATALRERGGDEILRKRVLHQLQRLVEEVLLVRAGVLELDGSVALREDADMLADVRDLEQPRLDAVVEIRGEVGNLVGEIDDLRLERRPLVRGSRARARRVASRCSHGSA